MLLTAAVCLILQQQQNPLQLPDVTLMREMRLDSVDKKGQYTLIQATNTKLEQPKSSPLNGWMFEHLTSGYARDSVDSGFNLRVRVYSQYRPDENDPTDYAARMIMRLWEFNRWRLNSDHTYFIHLRTVDVFLCAGGEPGAEQKTMEDPYQLDESGRMARVGNIYVYSVPTLTDRMEFARELAHEYGHATWPPMGGYTGPEQWISGDMGERIFLMWLLQAAKAKKIGTEDVMQVRLSDLQAYYDKRVLPDMRRVATKGPDLKTLKGTNPAAYTEALGLASYMGAALPHKVFGRALVLTKDRSGAKFIDAVMEAVTEAGRVEFKVPDGLAGSAVWIPLARGRLILGKPLRRAGYWVKVQPVGNKSVVQY